VIGSSTETMPSISPEAERNGTIRASSARQALV
jgi:hypothetical protein